MDTLPAHAFKTYGLSAPVRTHKRPASCDEAGCEAMANGWITRVDESTELGARQAGYIRSAAGRAFREARTPEGLTAFTFSPGQRCFGTHYVPLDRPPLFYVRDGDRRGDPGGGRSTAVRSAQDWLDDFATNQDRIKTIRERG
jgi:hypothetical protein